MSTASLPEHWYSMCVYTRTMMFLLQVTGLLPVSSSKSTVTGVVLRRCPFRTSYSIGLVILCCAIYVVKCWSILLDASSPSFYWTALKYRTEVILAVVNFFSTFGCCIVALYLAIFEVDRKICLLERLSNVDSIIRRKPAPLKTRPIVFISIIQGSALVVVNIILVPSKIHDVASQFSKLVNTCALLEFMEIILTIKDRFQLVNKLLVEVVLKPQHNTVAALPVVETPGVTQPQLTNISCLCKVHWTLSRLLLDTAVLYGPLILVMTIYIFFHLIFLPYYLFLLQR